MDGEIRAGEHVLVRDAFGDELSRRAVSGVVMGHDFQVVWVCTEAEWSASRGDDREPVSVPFPARSVRMAATA